jgi:hypothetical protein
MTKRLQVNIRADEALLKMLADLKPYCGTDRQTITSAVVSLWAWHFGPGGAVRKEHHEDGDDGRLD